MPQLIYKALACFGGAWWRVELLSKAQKVAEQVMWTMNAKETQNGWLRIAFDLPIQKSIDEITLYHKHQYDSWIDELLLKNKVEDVYHHDGDKLYFNNYLIDQ